VTPEQLAEKLRPWRARLERWLPLLAVVVLGLLVARSCNRAGEAERRAAAADERAAAAAAGVPVVQPVEDVRPALEEALRENDQLRDELARARRAVPGARPVLVVRAATEPAAVTAARPTDAPPATPGAVPVLLQGDQLRLELEQVGLEGKAGAHLVVGTMAARRVLDGALLLRQPFTAPLTVAVEKAAPAKRAARWRAGPLAGVGGGGWLAGALLATPSARVPLLGWTVEAWVGAAAGPGGAVLLAGVPVGP
jgi:hypothetical protein